MKTYSPLLRQMLTVIILMSLSGVIAVWLILKWQSSGNAFALIGSILLAVIFLVYARPIIEWREIRIEDGCVIVLRRFCKPLRLSISDSLYRIVLKGEYVRSFRFRNNNRDVQVSPIVYKEGNEMTDKILFHVEKNNMVVEFISV